VRVEVSVPSFPIELVEVFHNIFARALSPDEHAELAVALVELAVKRRAAAESAVARAELAEGPVPLSQWRTIPRD
jgi:uncharacterized membrane protein